MTKDSIGYSALIAKMQVTDAGGYVIDIPENWRQGRTAYGGITTGLAYACIQAAFEDLPPLRSVQISFVGPVTGSPVFTPHLLRKGRNVTSIAVDTVCEGTSVARATFMFGAGRESQITETLTAPKSPAPKDCEPYVRESMQNFVPRFILNFENRLIAGGRPMTGTDEAYIRVWSRHRDESSRSGIGSFLTLADVLPPAAAPLLKGPTPISSMNWHMNILQPDVGTDDGWWHVETRQTATQNGYSSQVMRFWNRAGLLVAEGMQSVAVFG